MKKIAFFINSNGYGHYDRCKEIASYLVGKHDISFYCKDYQYKKIGKLENTTLYELKKDTIRWDKNITSNSIRFEPYQEGLLERCIDLNKYDLVVSDNIVGILKYRPDAILGGSFFWKDVFLNKFGPNRLTDFDNELLEKHKPLILTNRYFETGTMKEYKNKKQFGFGCTYLDLKINKIDRAVLIEPSLPYFNSYKEFINNLTIPHTVDINVTENVFMVARPGGGIITHCVKHHIPLIALYDENDSSEILELADRVVDLGIGFKQNVKEKFNYNFLKDNSIYNSIQLIKDGYKQAANYLSSVI